MTTVPVSAATFLGDNTVTALGDLSRALAGAGVAVEIVPGARSSDDARRSAPGVDLVWLCGALFNDLRQSGLLDHEVIAVPVFDGQTEPCYHSVVISRADGPASIDDSLDGVVAVNEIASWSGHRTLRRHVAPRWFANQIETGSHAASISAVVSGAADVAAIDHTIWRSTSPADRDGLRVIERTVSWPAPPIVLRRDIDPAVRTVVVDVVRSAGTVTGVARFEPGTAERYEVMT